MEINVNDQMIELSVDRFSCFKDVMEKLTEDAADMGQIIIHVNLNGEDLTGKDRSHLDNLPIEEIHEFTIRTGDPESLALSTLYNLSDFLEQLINEIQNTSDLFRLRNDEKSSQAFLRCLDGFQVFMHSVERCRRFLGLSFELLKIPVTQGANTRTAAENRRDVFSVLDHLIEAQSNEDGILLADELEYELAPLLKEWTEIIPVMIGESKRNLKQDANIMAGSSPEAATAHS